MATIPSRACRAAIPSPRFGRLRCVALLVPGLIWINDQFSGAVQARTVRVLKACSRDDDRDGPVPFSGGEGRPLLVTLRRTASTSRPVYAAPQHASG